MPRYHFNVGDGHSRPDNVGTELADLPTAKLEAVKLAGAILSEGSEIVWGNVGWTLTVTDYDGIVLFMLRFAAANTIRTIQ